MRLGDPGNHSTLVDAWLERVSHEPSLEATVRAFEVALSAMWTRTNLTLGEVTLTAIAERVVHNAARRFPFFSSLTVDATRGIQCGALRERLGPQHAAQLIDGMRFILIELLTVIGNLTADILTPGLHQELSKLTVAKTRSRKKAPRRKDTRK